MLIFYNVKDNSSKRIMLFLSNHLLENYPMPKMSNLNPILSQTFAPNRNIGKVAKVQANWTILSKVINKKPTLGAQLPPSRNRVKASHVKNCLKNNASTHRT